MNSNRNPEALSLKANRMIAEMVKQNSGVDRTMDELVQNAIEVGEICKRSDVAQIQKTVDLMMMTSLACGESLSDSDYKA